MERFRQIFKKYLVFLYHCIDRLVINGYLKSLIREEQVAYFFKTVVGISVITKEVLSRRTKDYCNWVEAYACRQDIPIEWAEKGVRKEDYVRPHLQRFQRRHPSGVYFIFRSMEQGPSFRIVTPRYATQDPNHRFLRKNRSRYTHFYFYILDEVLGPFVMRVGTFLPFPTTYYLNGHSYIEQQMIERGIAFRKKDNAFLSTADPKALQSAADRLRPRLIQDRLDLWTERLGPKFSRRESEAMNLNRSYSVSQVEYCCNFIFRSTYPLVHLFRRSCDLGLLHLTADALSHIFGVRITKRLRGKLNTLLEKVDHGHHVLRAYCRNSYVKQYEKHTTFLRQEVCCNDLREFQLRKGLDSLPEARQHLRAILDRFSEFQADSFNVHADFPLLQTLAQPIMVGQTRIPGIKIHDPRPLRLLELLLHQGTQLTGWTTRQIHEAVLSAYGLKSNDYTLNQLRYDVRKLKAHGLLERNGKRYCYRLTAQGVKVALLLVFLHKKLAGPLSSTWFSFRLNPSFPVNDKLETAYHQADLAFQNVVDILKKAA